MYLKATSKYNKSNYVIFKVLYMRSTGNLEIVTLQSSFNQESHKGVRQINIQGEMSRWNFDQLEGRATEVLFGKATPCQSILSPEKENSEFSQKIY